MSSLQKFWEAVPPKVLSRIAKGYWAGDPLPAFDSEIKDQLAVDVEGKAFLDFVDHLNGDAIVALTSGAANDTPSAPVSLPKQKKTLLATLEEDGLAFVLGSPTVSIDSLRLVYSLVLKEAPKTSLSKEELALRIENACNKSAFVKFLSQMYFKDSQIVEWAKACDVDLQTNSRRLILEAMYDAIVAEVKPVQKKPPESTPKRARESEKEERDEEARRPTKKARVVPSGDVTQILGLCKPIRGSERPIRWKVVLQDGSEAVLDSTEMLTRGPHHLIDYFEEKILKYLDEAS